MGITQLEFTDQIERVGQLRENVGADDALFRGIQTQFETEHNDFLEQRKRTREALNGAENVLREMVVAHYQETGEKAPAPGLGIRIVNSLLITSFPAAFNWAKEHGMALKLDEKALEKIVRTGTAEVPGVEMRGEVQATLTSNFPAALAKAGDMP